MKTSIPIAAITATIILIAISAYSMSGCSMQSQNNESPKDTTSQNSGLCIPDQGNAAATATGNPNSTDVSSSYNKGNQTLCPVLGGEINKKYYYDYQGKRIYVCCGGCITPVKANPAKYINEMEAKGVVLETVPETSTSPANSDETKNPSNKK